MEINRQKKLAALSNRKHAQLRPAPTNLSAVLNHKRRFNVKDRSWYFDPLSNIGYRLDGWNVADTFEIASGLNLSSDGYTPLTLGTDGRPLYDRSTNLSSTGAGIFTFQPMRFMYGEPMFLMREASGENKVGRLTNQAFHAPASPQRAAVINDGNSKNNHISFGCISPEVGFLQSLVENNLISHGDTVYIQPKIPGNFIFENYGTLQTHFGDKPSEVSGKNYDKQYHLNNVRYNEGF